MGVKELCEVDVSALIEWVRKIPFEEWPQQHRVHPDRIRPAMATKLPWYGFGRETDSLVAELMQRHFSGYASNNRMLSVVMPDEGIEPHSDNPSSDWRVRVHVPLVTNDKAIFFVEGAAFHMTAGRAYLVNVRQRHEIKNDGPTPRIHFMFDVVDA